MNVPIICAESLQSLFHEQMPLTRAMGLMVKTCNREMVELRAPLSLNHNHLGTAFGGSLIALATAAAYGMLWTLIGETGSHLVIQSSNMRYMKPVRGDLKAICYSPAQEAVQEFIQTFQSKGKARIQCEVSLYENDLPAAVFTGIFVVLR